MPTPMPQDQAVPQAAPPQQVPQAQPQGDGAKGGGPAQLVEAIHTGLTQLMDLPLPDEAKQQLMSLIQGFQGFVESVGGAGSGTTGAGQGPAPMKGRIPANGGPNAIPAM